MNFTTKSFKCDHYADVVAKVADLEQEWAWALLSRFNVDPSKIEMARNDPSYPKSEWRDFLLANYGIQVEYNFASKKTIITRTNFKKGDIIVVGEWSTPEITQVKQKHGKWYEVQLKYFNLI